MLGPAQIAGVIAAAEAVMQLMQQQPPSPPPSPPAEREPLWTCYVAYADLLLTRAAQAHGAAASEDATPKEIRDAPVAAHAVGTIHRRHADGSLQAEPVGARPMHHTPQFSPDEQSAPSDETTHDTVIDNP